MLRSMTGIAAAAIVAGGCSAGFEAREPGFQTAVVIEAPLPIGSALQEAGPGPKVAGWRVNVTRFNDAMNVVDQVESEGRSVYRLDSGDKLRVFVYAQPSLSRIYTVDPEGRISVPLIGDVVARGQTARSLTHTIRARLARSYVRDPHVTVEISQTRPFFILGEVRAAGQYPFVPEMTVDVAVAIAGGYSERANQRQVVITRRINGKVEKIEAARDALVLPGDTVYVKERWF